MARIVNIILRQFAKKAFGPTPNAGSGRVQTDAYKRVRQAMKASQRINRV